MRPNNSIAASNDGGQVLPCGLISLPEIYGAGSRRLHLAGGEWGFLLHLWRRLEPLFDRQKRGKEALLAK